MVNNHIFREENFAGWIRITAHKSSHWNPIFYNLSRICILPLACYARSVLRQHTAQPGNFSIRTSNDEPTIGQSWNRLTVHHSTFESVLL
jgi:hypothetical protein